jgi:hypothetical protein
MNLYKRLKYLVFLLFHSFVIKMQTSVVIRSENKN